jgi:signal transduction histidine kinase
VSIRREADEVVVSVALGPDSSMTAAAERSWLARMATRYGGRWELDGSWEVLALPADGVEQRNDVAKLRQELDEARRQGEAYARELAVVWTGGDEAPGPSTTPPSPSSAADRFAAVARLAGGIAASLRGMLSPMGRELSELRAPPQRKSVPEIDLARLEAEDRIESVRRRLLSVQELVADLALVGELDSAEAARAIDLTELVRSEVYALAARAERAGVEVKITIGGAPGARPTISAPPRAATVLLRQVIGHAIAASPRGSAVGIAVEPAADGRGARVILDDSGATLPSVGRQALVGLEVDPSTYARPSGVALFVAAAIAAALPASLDLGDAPVSKAGSGTETGTGTAGGGVRVALTFAV